MCYGNSAISSFLGGSTGSAWNSSYAGVYHFPNGSSLSANDSSTYGNNGVNNFAAATSGKIDGAASFSGSGDEDLGNNPSLQISGQITLEAWVNFSSFPTSGKFSYILAKGFDGSNEAYYLRLSNTGTLNVDIGSYNGTNYSATLSNWSGSLNTWYHFVGLYDGTSWILYINGSQMAANSQTTGAINSAKDAFVGANDINGTVSRFMSGKIDEARIMNVGVSTNWIATEYNNQSSPGAFETFGGEMLP